MPPALELRNIVKRFPGVVANDHISLSVEAGEIRALVGENGAGKSTLMNILYGLYRPDEGSILIHGRRHRFHSPLDAIRAGLGMVHQHFMLFPSLTVAENVVYGSEPTRGGFVDKGEANAAVELLAEKHGMQLEPQARVDQLSVGACQRIEILKMLYRGAEILILDEPTAVLTPGERDRLFQILRQLAASGKTIVFITHKLPEVLALSDSATGLRDGKVTGTVVTADTDESALCRLMVGRDVELRFEKGSAKPARTKVLRVRGLDVRSASGKMAVRNLDLEVHAGEIVGIAGAAGNGQTDLVEALAGIRRVEAGEIELDGSVTTHLDVAGRRRKGQSHIPENRDEEGLALEATLAENLVMGYEAAPPITQGGVLSQAAIESHASALIAEYDIKTPGSGAPAHSLSGGNRQKLVLAREMGHDSKLLLAEQPTRGVDIGATEQIYRLLIDYRNFGRGVLLVSTDLAEILALADRILVMYEGRIIGEIPGAEATEETIGLLMGGGGG